MMCVAHVLGPTVRAWDQMKKKAGTGTEPQWHTARCRPGPAQPCNRMGAGRTPTMVALHIVSASKPTVPGPSNWSVETVRHSKEYTNATHTTARSLPRYLQTPHSIPKPHQQPQCTSSPWYSLSGNTKWQERKSYHHRLHNYFHSFHHTEATACKLIPTYHNYYHHQRLHHRFLPQQRPSIYWS
eukprot:scpid102230/ scgid16965/ 